MIAPRLARAPRGRKVRKRQGPRPRVIAPPQLQRLVLSEYLPRWMPPRPRKRSQCPRSRPCPWVACRYHLYLEVTEKGSLKLNFPDLEPWDLPVSCALDVAELGGLTLDEVGIICNVTRERVRQLKELALVKLRQAVREVAPGLEEYRGNTRDRHADR